jgi:DNA helicase II / ATP-dependent DNA helicase PcrA
VDPLEGLNREQQRAAEAVRGPVCILAGAGSGKTTTITRRIAHQVRSGAFAAEQVMAVTFSEKAAGELKSRLAALGVDRVRASTFHSAALRQLRHFAPGEAGRILPSKALALRQLANALPAPYKFRPAGDLATEIEWAKNRRIPPEGYRAAERDHEPPVPIDLMHRIYREYEQRKRSEGAMDFEDLLALTIGMFERDRASLDRFQDQYEAFTVDEYQDVNLLQQSLLDLWLGDRDDLCVVGDDYQSIYGFTGASPSHLLGMAERFPHALVVRLEENYRSTPQVLDLANRLVPGLGGAQKVLRATLPDGAAPAVAPFASPDAEGAAIVARIRELKVPLEEVAILCRTNARLTDFEELLHEAGVPFQGASLLERDAARRLIRAIDRRGEAPAAAAVREAALEAGWTPVIPDSVGERELVRQTDLARLVSLAGVFDGDVSEFIADLRRRFDPGAGHVRGVHLLTLHRAKGLEFEVVFVPRLTEKELPAKQARTPERIAEERRLLYVGLTRARRELWVTWAGKPSRFVRELADPGSVSEPGSRLRRPAAAWTPAGEKLRAWRLERARADEVPPYVVFHDSTLQEIAEIRPTTLGELSQVSGVGPAKLERYGADVLRVLGQDGEEQVEQDARVAAGA